MTRPLSELEAIFRDGLNLAPDAAVRHLKYRDVPEWSSVGHMALIAAIETALDLMLETDDVLDMSSFEKAVSILRKYDVDFAA